MGVQKYRPCDAKAGTQSVVAHGEVGRERVGAPAPFGGTACKAVTQSVTAPANSTGLCRSEVESLLSTRRPEPGVEGVLRRAPTG
jgi:hypothetical protein